MGVDLNYSFPLKLSPHILVENLAIAFGGSCLLKAQKYKEAKSAYCTIEAIEYRALAFSSGLIPYGIEARFCDTEGTRRSMHIIQRQGEDDESNCSPQSSTLWLGGMLRANLLLGGSLVLRDSDDKTKLSTIKEIISQNIGRKIEKEAFTNYLLSKAPVLTPAELFFANNNASYQLESINIMLEDNKLDANIGYFNPSSSTAKAQKNIDIQKHFKEQKIDKPQLNKELNFLKIFETSLNNDFEEVFKEQKKVKLLCNIVLFKLLNESFECLFESAQNKEILENQAHKNNINLEEKMWLVLPQKKESKRKERWMSLGSSEETFERHDYCTKINSLLSEEVAGNQFQGGILLWGIQELANCIKKLPVEKQSEILCACIAQVQNEQNVFYSFGNNETRSDIINTIANEPEGFVQKNFSAELSKELTKFVKENVEQECFSNKYLYAVFLSAAYSVIVKELTDNFNNLNIEEFLDSKRQAFLEKGIFFCDKDSPAIIDLNSLLSVTIKKEVKASESAFNKKESVSAMSALAQKNGKTIVDKVKNKNSKNIHLKEEYSFSLLGKQDNQVKESNGIDVEKLNEVLNSALIQEEQLKLCGSINSAMSLEQTEKTIVYFENLFKALSKYGNKEVAPKVQQIIKQTTDIISLTNADFYKEVFEQNSGLKNENKVFIESCWSQIYFDKLKAAHLDAIVEVSDKNPINKKQIENCILDANAQPYETLDEGVYQSFVFANVNPLFFNYIDKVALGVCTNHLFKAIPVLGDYFDIKNKNEIYQKYEDFVLNTIEKSSYTSGEKSSCIPKMSEVSDNKENNVQVGVQEKSTKKNKLK